MRWPWTRQAVPPAPSGPLWLSPGEDRSRLMRPALNYVLASRQIEPPEGWIDRVLSEETDDLTKAEFLDYLEAQIDLLDPPRLAYKLAEALRAVERIRSQYRRAIAKQAAS